jgi:hypothetical protein
MVLVDEDRALDLVLDLRDPPFDEGLLVLGLLVFGVLGEIAVLLGLADARGDLGARDGGHLLELRTQPLEPFPGDVGGPVVHGPLDPVTGVGPAGAGRRWGRRITERTPGRSVEVRPWSSARRMVARARARVKVGRLRSGADRPLEWRT